MIIGAFIMKKNNELTFNNKNFSIKIYINNIRYFSVMMIGFIVSILLTSILFIEEDKDMKIAVIFVLLFFIFGVLLLSLVLIRSVFLKSPSFILDNNGIYYNNLIVKKYLHVFWSDIKDLDIIGSYLFIYLKNPRLYHLKRFNKISDNPLYIHIGDLDMSNRFVNSMFNFFYDNHYKEDEEEIIEDDYRKYCRDYY